jgi:predicted HicB family RNase H-like nuclease
MDTGVKITQLRIKAGLHGRIREIAHRARQSINRTMERMLEDQTDKIERENDGAA